MLRDDKYFNIFLENTLKLITLSTEVGREKVLGEIFLQCLSSYQISTIMTVIFNEYTVKSILMLCDGVET